MLKGGNREAWVSSEILNTETNAMEIIQAVELIRLKKRPARMMIVMAPKTNWKYTLVNNGNFWRAGNGDGNWDWPSSWAMVTTVLGWLTKVAYIFQMTFCMRRGPRQSGLRRKRR